MIWIQGYALPPNKKTVLNQSTTGCATSSLLNDHQFISPSMWQGQVALS